MIRRVMDNIRKYLTDFIFKMKKKKMASYVHLENKTTFLSFFILICFYQTYKRIKLFGFNL